MEKQWERRILTQVKRSNEIILSTEQKQRNGHKSNSEHIKQNNVIAG